MDLETENHEDDFQAVVANVWLDDSPIWNGWVYVDANDTREHPTSRLISALQTKKESTIINNEDDLVSMLTYRNQRQAKLLNDHDDPTFFTAAFSTLFPFGIWGPYCCKLTKNPGIASRMGKMDLIASYQKARLPHRRVDPLNLLRWILWDRCQLFWFLARSRSRILMLLSRRLSRWWLLSRWEKKLCRRPLGSKSAPEMAFYQSWRLSLFYVFDHTNLIDSEKFFGELSAFTGINLDYGWALHGTLSSSSAVRYISIGNYICKPDAFAKGKFGEVTAWWAQEGKSHAIKSFNNHKKNRSKRVKRWRTTLANTCIWSFDLNGNGADFSKNNIVTLVEGLSWLFSFDLVRFTFYPHPQTRTVSHSSGFIFAPRPHSPPSRLLAIIQRV